MKKKILALLLSSICILGGTSVYAEDTNTTLSNNTAQSAKVSVSITKPETWEVLVPKNITLSVTGDTAKSATQDITVTGDLYGGRTLTLDILPTCTLHNTKGTTNTLVAQVNTVGNTPKSFTSDDLHNKADNKYQFDLSASNVKAETWIGTMTVNVSVS